MAALVDGWLIVRGFWHRLTGVQVVDNWLTGCNIVRMYSFIIQPSRGVL